MVQWFDNCSVVVAGMDVDQDRIVVALTDADGAFADRQFVATEASRRELLATALTALASSRRVRAALEDGAPEFSTLHALYATGRIPVAPVTPGGSGTGTDDAGFVSTNMPMALDAGQTLEVNVVMLNSGSTVWAPEAGYRLQPADGSARWGIDQAAVHAPTRPGASATFVLTITAPREAGDYLFQWQMYRAGQGGFGAATDALTVAVGPGACDRLAGELELVNTAIRDLERELDRAEQSGATIAERQPLIDALSAQFNEQVRITQRRQDLGCP